MEIENKPKMRGGLANMTKEQRTAALEKAKATREANKAAGIKTAKKLTPRRAIRMKCEDCMAGSKAEVRRCETRSCSLWTYRCRNPENTEVEPVAVGETGDPDIDAALAEALADGEEDFDDEEEETEEKE